MSTPEIRALHIWNFVPAKHGALERFLIAWSRACHEVGIRTTFLFPGEPVAWFREAIAPYADLHWTAGHSLTHGYRQTLALAWRLRPRVITVSFMPLFSVRLLALALLPGCGRLIFIDRSSVEVSDRKPFMRFLAWLRGRVFGLVYWRVVSVSCYNRTRNVVSSGIPPARNEVIYNGVAAAAALPAEPSRPGYLLYAGQLTQAKGVHTLLRAYAQAFPDSGAAAPRLRLAGLGPDREALLRLAAELGIGERVEFLGLCNNVPELMAGAVAIVVPSEWPEAFGFVAAEAMSTGRPLIVSDAGALPEVVGDTAIVFARGQAAELAACLRQVTAAPGNLAARTAAARLRVRDYFSLERMVAQYRELLLRAAGWMLQGLAWLCWASGELPVLLV